MLEDHKIEIFLFKKEEKQASSSGMSERIMEMCAPHWLSIHKLQTRFTTGKPAEKTFDMLRVI